VGVLRLAGAAASLPEERCLLIARDSGNRQRFSEERGYRLAKISCRGTDFGQDFDRYLEEIAELFAPTQPVDVEKQSPRCVCRIGRVHPPTRELPDQPAVDRASEQSSISRDERDLRLLEQPFDFRRREIG